MSSTLISSLLLLCLSSAFSATTTTDLTKPFSYNITFVIKPNTFPTIIGHLVLDEGKSIKTNLTTETFKQALNLNSINTTKLIKLIDNTININVTQHLFEIFDKLNISYTNTYNEFTTGLNEVEVTQALKKLNISFVDLVTMNKNESEFKSIFRNGLFTEETINASLRQINKTQEEVLNFLKPIILNKLFGIEINKLVEILKPFDLVHIIEKFFKELNVKQEKDLAQAVEIFTEYLNKIDKKPIATAISRKNLVTSDLVYNSLVGHDYLTINISKEISILNMTFTNNYLNISTLEPITNFIPITTNYSKPAINCKYMQQNVSLNGFYLNKAKSIYFISGSPLICEEKLYGIASQNFSNKIGFTMFNKTILPISSSYSITASYWLTMVAVGCIGYINV